MNHLSKLERESLPLLRGLFAAPHLGYVYESVIAGHTAADIWTDDPDRPRAVFMWDGVHGYYLAGAASDVFTAGLRRLLEREVAPEAVRRGRAFFKVICDGEGWAESLPVLFAPAELHSYPRTCFSLPESPPAGRRDAPEGFLVAAIEAGILAGPERPNVEHLLGEIRQMWGTVEHFLADGFGWCALHGDALAGWGTAEYLSPGAVGLGVETVEEYQRRGLATVLAMASLETARSRGLRPYWDAWTGNIPSVRVAEKAGLVPVSSYNATVGSWPGD